MGIEINSASIRSLFYPGINSIVSDTNTYDHEYAAIYTKHKSTKQFESDVEIKFTGMAQLKEEGDSTAYDTMQQMFTTTYLHNTVSLAFVITEEAFDDNQYATQFPRGSVALNDSLLAYKNVVGATLFNNATSTNYPLGDGQPLLSTAHPTYTGTFANTFSVPAQLNESSLMNAYQQNQLFTSAAGLQVMSHPEKLLVPVQMEAIAEKLLRSRYTPGSPDNAVNPINSLGMFPKGYVVNHYLTNPYSWFILNRHPDGFKYFERKPIKIDIFMDIKTNNMVTRCTERYSMGCSNARATFGSIGN